MKKNVWILNHYATDMLFSKGGRHYWFAKYLKREGYEPVIFSCNTKHGVLEKFFETDKLWIEKKADEIDVPFVIIKSSLYKGNGKDRILNMIGFYRNVQKAAKEYAKTHEKPDVIYASSVHPLTLVAGIKLAKYFKIKCICEVRDLWPLSLVEYGFLREYSLIAKALYRGERWIYEKADEIIFTGGGFEDYIKERGWNKFISKSKIHYINNGIDLNEFERNKENFRIEDKDLNNKINFKVIYAGSIKKVNNLGLLLDIAKKIKNKKIVFLIWGDGEEKELLIERVKNEKIKNVILKGSVEKKYIPYITSSANLNFAHCNPSDLFRFGISFNKIFDYLAAGKPILCDFKSNYNPVILLNAGKEVEMPEPENVADIIEDFFRMEENEYNEYCHNALIGAKMFDFENLTKELCKIIEA